MRSTATDLVFRGRLRVARVGRTRSTGGRLSGHGTGRPRVACAHGGISLALRHRAIHLVHRAPVWPKGCLRIVRLSPGPEDPHDKTVRVIADVDEGWGGEGGDSKLCSLREQLGNSRTQSYGVARCRFVFGRRWLNSLTQNPAYSPPSVHQSPRPRHGGSQHATVANRVAGH